MYEKIGVYHHSLILSPDYSREKLSLLIQQTKESLDIYFPYLQDESFENLIFSAAESNIQINFIVDKIFYDENPERIIEYQEK
jgi:Trm5-related predicted tRNA methylase